MTIAVDGDDKHQTKQTNADIYYAHQRETTEINRDFINYVPFQNGHCSKRKNFAPALKGWEQIVSFKSGLVW